MIKASATQPKYSTGGPRLLSIPQAARELNVSRTLLYELISDDALRTVKIRRRRFVPRDAIDEFIAGLGR